MPTTNPRNVIVWIHADNLNPYGPALKTVQDAPAIFVWDDELLSMWRISFKRITFIYECLLELPVTIRRGDVASEVLRFALDHGASRIVTAESPSPRFRQIGSKISQSMPSGSRLEVMREKPFVSERDRVDLKRFSRYWRAVQSEAMKPTDSN